MAERRMFTKKVTDSDDFTAMPPTAQCLYFHLCMSADDDGFSNQIRRALFSAHAGTDDFNTLVSKRFVIPFDNGVIVIRHWKMHNIVRSDRYHETEYLTEKATLLLEESGTYEKDTPQLTTNGIPDGNQVATKCIPLVYKMETEVRLGKDRIGKDSVGKQPHKRFTPPTREEVAAYCTERGNKVDPDRFVDFYTSKGWMVGKSPMKDWKAAVRGWEREAKQKAEKPQNRFAVKDNANDYDFDALERRKLKSRNQSK